MLKPEIGCRTVLFICAAGLLSVILFYISSGSPAVPDTLPARLTNEEFWSMVNDFSEAGGYFRSDNFLSNESGYQFVIPSLRRSVELGGVYLGVGPEQNFTYIVGLEPKMAFVVDIRRQNMLEHLLYKSLMEVAADRAEFLSFLFCRPKPASLHTASTADALVQEYQLERSDAMLFETNVLMVLHHLEEEKGFALSADDEAAVRKVYQAFFESGPELSYTFVGGYGGYLGMPTYADLMTENDGHTHNWNFLATEDQFQLVRRLQKNNLIVPLVGDFAGPKAIRAIGKYLKQHRATLTVFYTSNVEQYLFQDDTNWRHFYENVSALPLTSASTFIRHVLSSRGFSRRSRTLMSPILDVLGAYNNGRIQSYYDVIEMSRN